jgi:tetratricopeptide (TPR) repeat protein
MNGVYESLAELPIEEVASLVPLGSLAIVLGKQDAGVRHLERAVTLAPDHVVALNNLAYGLAERGGEVDLERALELVDRAVAVANDRGVVPANCWETRGQIFAKLGRWQEAAVDLERALTQMAGSAPVHETLGKVYRELGQDDLAEEHLRQAARN